MPRKTKTATAEPWAALPQIPAELPEKLTPGPVTPGQLEDIFQRFNQGFIHPGRPREGYKNFLL